MIQVINLVMFSAVLAMATRRRLYKMPYLPLYLWAVHAVAFYVVVVLRDCCGLWVVNTMIWSAAMRLGLSITLLSYLILWRRL